MLSQSDHLPWAYNAQVFYDGDFVTLLRIARVLAPFWLHCLGTSGYAANNKGSTTLTNCRCSSGAPASQVKFS